MSFFQKDKLNSALVNLQDLKENGEVIEDFFDQENFSPFIGGSFVESDKDFTSHFSVAQNKAWKKIRKADASDLKLALTLSDEGNRHLKALSSYERAGLLEQMARELKTHKEKLALWITLEMGKTIQEAKQEVDYAASYFSWFADEAKRTYGYTIPSHVQGKRILIEYEPIGTVAIITPWNYPLAMGARKIAPAIAAGCSCIVKPSSTTPLCMLALGRLSQEAHFPRGALSILPTGPELITDLLDKEQVRKLTFTGSTQVGRELLAKCAPTLKKVTMELGGHAPLLVFETADLKRAVEETIEAKLRVSGQTCICPNRIFVHEKVIEPFCQMLKKEVQRFRIGSPLEEESDLTNRLHPTSIAKIKKQIQDALDKGAKALLLGKEPFEPAILTNMTFDMEMFCEETFGPIFPIASFETESQAITLANQTPYGLAAYVFTQDLGQASRLHKGLDFGIIGINDGRPSAAQIPFGGVKASGFGREGGPRGIYEYLVEKSISIKE